MPTPQIKLVNATTGEEIIRDMNNQELEQYQLDKALEDSKKETLALKAAAKATAEAKLAALGLNPDDLKALGF